MGIVLVGLPGVISPNHYMHNYVSTIHTYAELYDPSNHNDLTLIGCAVMIERRLQTLSFTQASGPAGHVMWTVMEDGITCVLLFFCSLVKQILQYLKKATNLHNLALVCVLNPKPQFC
jgi:hypothetical protein